MLVNELSAGEKILDELANASGLKSVQSGALANEQIREFKRLCAKAREAWALAVFSDISKETLERYFTYHLQVLSGLSERLSDMPDYPVAECVCSPKETIRELFEKENNCLIDYLFLYFGNYPDKNINSPFSYRCHIINELNADVNFIRRSLEDRDLSPGLKSGVAAYIEHMLNNKESIFLTFGQLAYFQKFIREIKKVLSIGLIDNLKDSFSDKLLELEFNHIEIFTCFQDEVRLSIAEKNDEEKLLIIDKKRQLFNFNNRDETERYDSRWPKLSTMLSEWLTNEAKVLTKGQTNNQPTSMRTGYKFKLEISVAHLACLVRLFSKENLLGAVPLTETFKFICDKFRTKRAETLSVGGLSKEYYSISQITAAEIKDLLSKMIARINREYFPVMAAIGIVIYAC